MNASRYHEVYAAGTGTPDISGPIRRGVALVIRPGPRVSIQTALRALFTRHLQHLRYAIDRHVAGARADHILASYGHTHRRHCQKFTYAD